MIDGRRTRRLAWRFLLAVALLFAGAANAGEPDARDGIRALIARGILLQLQHPDFTAYRSALDAFYRANGYAPQWLGRDGAQQAALTELDAAPTHGLDPADYDVEWLRNEFASI